MNSECFDLNPVRPYPISAQLALQWLGTDCMCYLNNVIYYNFKLNKIKVINDIKSPCHASHCFSQCYRLAELVHGELDSGRHIRNFPAKQYGTDIKTMAPHQFLYEKRQLKHFS